MEITVADSIVYSLLKNVSQLLAEETSLIFNARDQIESLQGELKFINEFLRLSEGKRDKVREVVRQIQDVALEAEDLIDDFIVNMANHKTRNMLLRFLLVGEKIKLLRNVAVEIQHINTKLKKIHENKDKYHITNDEGVKSKKVSIQHRRRNVEEDEVVSFQNDAELVTKMLDTRDSRRDVVSVIGMGGLGKTTLAKKIYNGRFVKQSFDCRAWVDVSQDYNPKDLLLKIAESVFPSTKTEESDKLTEEELVMKLRAGLAGMRYLIVLDDVWDKHLWNGIKAAFPDNGKRSRILLTSRVKEVASHASTHTPPYFLPLLNEDDSWKLFSRKVFHGDVCPSKIEEIATQQILTKCKGLPLAITVVAGLLRNREESMWTKVVSGLNWYLEKDPTECLGILALSYDDLPPHLKSCFLYFGVYPEDFEIPARQLIRLWVAEGFLDQEEGSNLDMEDMAEEYFLQLIDRSLIQVATRRTDGGIKSCRIHDLLRDLSISEGKRENFPVLDTNVNRSSSSSSTKPRRLSVHFGSRDIRYDYLSVPEFSRLLSLHSFGINKIQRYTDALYKNPFTHLSKLCRYLRVLDLDSSTSHFNCPPKVEKLVQLRYLRMNARNVDEIMPAISKLVNLQTLDVRHACSTWEKLWEMKQLRHLLLSLTLATHFDIPKGNSALSNLCTLSAINLHREDDGKILKRFPNLKKLKAVCHKEDLGLFEYLSRLQRLHTLNIEGKFQFTTTGALPLSLTKITLSFTYLDTPAFAKLGRLPNLQVLKLRYKSLQGSKLEYNSNQGQFPRLEVLHIHGLDIERWSMEGQGLKSLVHLSIDSCSKLRSIPDQLQQLSTLSQLKVTGCHDDLKESLKQIWVNDPRYISKFPRTPTTMNSNVSRRSRIRRNEIYRM